MRSRRPLLASTVAALLLVSCAPTETVSTTADVAGSTPVVLDGDFGPDDMMALFYLLQRPDLDVLAVTVSGTGLVHCPQGAANAAAILSHLGRADIPVACGPDEPTAGGNAFPEEWRAGSDELATSLGVEPYIGHVDTDAVGLLTETIGGAGQPVRLLVLGPMTNIALALDASPDLVDDIADITMMAGAFDVNGSVAPDYLAEWNVWVDSAAAQRVIGTPVPKTIVPLDATNDVPATQFFFDTLTRTKRTPEAKLVWAFFATHDYNLEGGSYFFWDPLAAVALVEPDIVDLSTRSVEVDQATGQTLQADGGAEVEVAVAADRRGFEEEFLTLVNGGSFVEARIPEPDLTVHYADGACTYQGDTEFDLDGNPDTSVFVEVVNDTEEPVAVMAGAHDGVSWEQLKQDAVVYEETLTPPEYWVQAGTIGIAGHSVTGGATVGALELEPGTYAIACGTAANDVILLTDIVVSP
jgi:pyrimidine-specific ribonucleoside hydrolase